MNGVALLARDIYVPLTGRHHIAYAGHHNIAWELSEHPEFFPSRGTLAGLVKELRLAGHASACISAEDLEFVYNRPDRIRLLETAIRSAGYEPRIIVYLRPQAQYCVSLYAEYAKFGTIMPFSDYVDHVVRTGTFGDAPHETQFDYELLLENFAAVFGDERIIVRPYISAGDSNALLQEFLDLITPPDHGVGISLATPERLNVSPAQPREVALNETQLARLVARFGPGNAAVARRFGIAVPVVDRPL